nr:hypothetical protein [uncultured Shinella sp.]
MGNIADAFNAGFPDGPVSSPAKPDKPVIRSIGSAIETVINQAVSDLTGQIEGAAAGSIAAATWSALSALTGTRAGQPADVPVTDTGTHTDPVVGGTVSNSGRFAWSVSPAGWRRIGPSVDPTAVTASINLSSMGVLTATAAPVASSGWTVAWTQARGVWNGTVITIADQSTVTLANGETMYVDLAGGSSPYTVTKAATTSGLRADFAAGRKLQLLYNQTGTLVGPMAAILLSVGQAAQYDPAEIVVQIATNNVISIYVKANADPYSAKYIRYRMELIQTPSDGSPAGQADIWTIQGVYEHLRTGPDSFTQVRTLCDLGNVELAIRESGKSDSMGGAAHGDHKKNSSGLRLLIDGTAKAFTGLSSVATYRCKTVSFLQSSTLYRADTTPVANTVAALVDQRWEWANGQLDLYQRVQFKLVMTLNFAMLGMLPAVRFAPEDGGFSVTAAAERYSPLVYEDVSTDGFTRLETQASTLKLMGSNGHGFEMQAEAGWELPGRKSYVSPDPNRNKGYLDFVGNGYVSSLDEVIQSRVRYRLTIQG